MGILVWFMMGIALWHFTVFLPDRFWSGIVGAFVGSTVGAVVFGIAVYAGDIPGKDDTEIVDAFIGIPGALIGIAVVWFIGVRQEQAAAAGST